MRLLQTTRHTQFGPVPVYRPRRPRPIWTVLGVLAFTGAITVAFGIIVPLTIECIELEGRIAVQQRQGETQR